MHRADAMNVGFASLVKSSQQGSTSVIAEMHMFENSKAQRSNLPDALNQHGQPCR